MLAVPIAFSMHEAKQEMQETSERYLQTLVHGVSDVWRHASLRYIILFSGVIWMATFTPLIFQQPFLNDHGVATGDLGLWQAPVRAGGIVAALLAYQFVARMGQRGAFFALPVMLIIANLALAGIDYGWAASAFLGIGVVAGLTPPIMSTYINNRIVSSRRATILSVQSVVQSGMLAVCEPIGGLVADQYGLRAMFVTFAVITAALAFPLLFLVDTRRARAVRPGRFEPRVARARARGCRRLMPADAVITVLCGASADRAFLRALTSWCLPNT